MRTTITLFTIVAESVLEDRLVRDLEAVGVRGWTSTSARGHSSTGLDPGEFAGGNVRLEVLISPERADAVWELLERDYFPLYSVVAWASAAEVKRPDKYG